MFLSMKNFVKKFKHRFLVNCAISKDLIVYVLKPIINHKWMTGLILFCILAVSLLIWTFSSVNSFLIGGGSTSVAPMLAQQIEQYEKMPNNKYNILYNAIGSSSAIEGTKNDSYQFGFTSDPLSDADAKAFYKNNNIARFSIAKDFVVIAYHLPEGATVKNPAVEDDQVGHLEFNVVNSASQNQLIKLYKDHQTWSSVFGNQIEGGNVKPETFSRENGSGTRSFFDKSVVFSNNYQADRTIGSNGEMLTAIENTPNSIGYLGFAFARTLIEAKKPNVNVGKVFKNKKPVAPYQWETGQVELNQAYGLYRPFTGIVNVKTANFKSVMRFLAWIMNPYPAEKDLVLKNTKIKPLYPQDDAAYWALKTDELPLTRNSDYFIDYNQSTVPGIPNVWTKYVKPLLDSHAIPGDTTPINWKDPNITPDNLARAFSNKVVTVPNNPATYTNNDSRLVKALAQLNPVASDPDGFVQNDINATFKDGFHWTCTKPKLKPGTTDEYYSTMTITKATKKSAAFVININQNSKASKNGS